MKLFTILYSVALLVSTVRADILDEIAAAEPQLFSCVEFADLPPSLTEMVINPDPKDDSFAVAVWGVLEEYDWTDLVEKEEVPCN